MFEALTGWVMWLYILIASIVLVNLLVAMFADTYTRIKESSELEYTYLRCAVCTAGSGAMALDGRWSGGGSSRWPVVARVAEDGCRIAHLYVGPRSLGVQRRESSESSDRPPRVAVRTGTSASSSIGTCC